MPPLIAKQSFLLTIFGASGSLARLKLLPDIYWLAYHKRLPKNFYIVGFARTSKTHEAFRTDFKNSVRQAVGSECKESILKNLLEHIFYFSGEYSNRLDFVNYFKFIETLRLPRGATRVNYFSVPPTLYKEIVGFLGEYNKNKSGETRLVFEKPFGTNRQNAEELFNFISKYFSEESVYLLDHYLGKSAVRSMLRLREENSIVSQMLESNQIANIQITAFEDVGVAERAKYYDSVGAIKDMVQSHLLQLFALVTMSIPIDQTAASLQRERHSVLAAISCPTDAGSIVLGQYQGYTREPDVPKDSQTETFVATRMFINRLNWSGVPVYFRTGKKLAHKRTYAVVELKKFSFQSASTPPNRIIFEFFPGERLAISLVNKLGEDQSIREIVAEAPISCSVEEGCLPEYATLLLDIFSGRKKYFVSLTEVISAWNVVDEIENLIKKNKIKLIKYAVHSDGPLAALTLPKQDGFAWFNLN